MSSPQNILILGGTGFIGRNFVSHLLNSSSFPPSLIKVVDIKHPAMCNLGSFKMAFDDPRVTFQQGDLSKERSVSRAFQLPEDSDSPGWDLVVNLAAETAHGSSTTVYDARCSKLSGLCAFEAAKTTGTFYVEISTARVYPSMPRYPATETEAPKPHTVQAWYKLEAERRVQAVESLDSCVLRPAIVYGVGDRKGLMSRAVCAATYVGTGEVMKFLWDGALRMNTVHVVDVCRAVEHAALNKEEFKNKVFNLADSGDSDQQKVNGCLGEIFCVEVGFVGKLISNVARINMDGVVQIANDKVSIGEPRSDRLI